MAQIFNIVDDKVVINKLAYRQSEGGITHIGTFRTTGAVTFDTTVDVAGTLSVNTLHVKNLVTGDTTHGDVGNWVGQSDTDLNGKGLQWSTGSKLTQLSYLSGSIWANQDINLEASKAYKIDGIDVISAGTLGTSITRSNLKQLGTLNSLSVVGNANLGEFAFFNSGFGRLGLGTDQPNSALSIVTSEVEIAIGSQKLGVAEIGTYSNHNVEIITDNTARITVKKDGDIIIGDEDSKNGVLRVYGTIHAEEIVSDTRINRTSSLEFKQTRDSSVYGKGLLWLDGDIRRELIMKAGPERVWTSESFDIGENKTYSVNGQVVLGQDYLGLGVTRSSLTRLGELESLVVQGPATFNNKVTFAQLKTNGLNLSGNSLDSDTNVVISVNSKDVLYADNDEITIGNKTNTRRPVKVYGPLSVGISNPDDSVDLAVKGDISFSNKKFLTGSGAPEVGTFSRGDIVWNTHPIENSYIGWVCVVEGSPGEWLPFGAIGRR